MKPQFGRGAAQQTPDRDLQLLARVDALRNEIAGADPHTLARRAGCSYLAGDEAGGEFHLALWGRSIKLGYPDWQASYLSGDEAPHTANLALLVYYFHSVWAWHDNLSQDPDGWIAFTELPDGRFYTQAFQGYTGAILARRFGNDCEAFRTAALSCNGAALDLGDAAFSFEVFPRVSLAVVCWQGDEDFPPSYRVLFSASVGSYLPTDACAIAGSMLTRQIISYRQSS